MTRDQALRKVLACLRLAGSSNPHEAAAALRQANALMAKYGLTPDDAAAAEIADHDATTGFRGGELPKSLLRLANMIAGGYRCEVVQVAAVGVPALGIAGRTTLRFFGAGADAQVAAYAFTVLRRQLDADRKRYTARVRKRANKERRGEEFALGWLVAVGALFPRAGLADDRRIAIEAAIRTRLGSCGQTTGRELVKGGRASENDRSAGYLAGRQAQLHTAVSESGQRRLEHA